MKSLQFTEYGRPNTVRLIETPDPTAGPGEVVVELEVAALNPSDFMILDGQYAIRPALPSGIGSEGVGHVSTIGTGVESFSVGDRVLIVPSASRGTWAEKIVVAANQVIRVAQGIDGQQLSMAGINGLTAVLLLRYGALPAGDWVAQTAANSGLGAFVRSLAISKGLNVLDVVRRADTADTLRSAGAATVVVAGADLAAQTRAILGDQQLGLVLDGVGGDAVGQLAAMLRPHGHIVSFAALGGQPVVINPASLIINNLHLHGLWLERWLQDAPYQDIVSAYQEIAPLLADGTFKAPVAATYPLAQFETALRESRAYDRAGKCSSPSPGNHVGAAKAAPAVEGPDRNGGQPRSGRACITGAHVLSRPTEHRPRVPRRFGHVHPTVSRSHLCLPAARSVRRGHRPRSTFLTVTAFGPRRRPRAPGMRTSSTVGRLRLCWPGR